MHMGPWVVCAASLVYAGVVMHSDQPVRPCACVHLCAYGPGVWCAVCSSDTLCINFYICWDGLPQARCCHCHSPSSFFFLFLLLVERTLDAMPPPSHLPTRQAAMQGLGHYVAML